MKKHTSVKVGNGHKTSFRMDNWLRSDSLMCLFLDLAVMAVQHEVSVVTHGHNKAGTFISGGTSMTGKLIQSLSSSECWRNLKVLVKKKTDLRGS
ncbi:hypothetical protein MTR67_047758 [Solanum verrucosum]|uniref:Uncharacterized protein n=1 Tax=Solanum verrucosum TaxID=315347 RepID=A0AAF0V067_SOLVR|nr:hypothetical protein MTR67_047758 [Solanum verrucosum]